MGNTELTTEQLRLLQEVIAGSFAHPEAAAAAVGRYLDELFRGNGRFGLIAREDAADRDRLFIRHIIDSLVPWSFIAGTAEGSGRRRLYDLGSGAGLPGIPLAVACAGRLDEVVLVERRAKRVSFLRGAVPLLRAAYREEGVRPDMPEIRIVDVDAALLPEREGDRLADGVVVFRAFQQTTEESLRFLSETFPPATPVCVYKGRTEQTELEARLIAGSRWASDEGEEAVRVLPLSVPGLEAERSLLMWRTARPA